MQKFKLLAMQCAVAGSPSRSPSASPVIHLRRRKTLRMLLSRGVGRRLPPRCQDVSSDRRPSAPEKGKELLACCNKLKDLFVSSPPGLAENMREMLLPSTVELRRSSMRPLSATFRQRLLRRAWRPVLVAIPE